MIPIAGHALYLAITIGVTVWVARTLHANGRAFLVDCFHGNVAMADAVNRMLVVGFYLVNIGWVALALRFGARPATELEVVESVSTKVGGALLLLGVLHLQNLAIFTWMRRRAVATRAQ